MTTIEADDFGRLDAALEALPNSPAVFMLWPHAKASLTFRRPDCCGEGCCVC